MDRFESNFEDEIDSTGLIIRRGEGKQEVQNNFGFPARVPE